MNFEDKLKEKMKEIEKKKVQNTELVTKEFFLEEFPEELESKFENIFQDEEMTDEEILFVKAETKNLINLQTNDILEYGRILNSVFEKFSNQGSKEGIYTKWLKFTNTNNKTALRYRKKYKIYEGLENKKLILGVTNKVVDSFEINTIIEELNNFGEVKTLELKKKEKQEENVKENVTDREKEKEKEQEKEEKQEEEKQEEEKQEESTEENNTYNTILKKKEFLKIVDNIIINIDYYDLKEEIKEQVEEKIAEIKKLIVF